MPPKVVSVPRPKAGSFKKSQPLFDERQAEIVSWREAESKLPLELQTHTDIRSLKTEDEATAYIQAVRAKLLPIPPVIPQSNDWVLIVGAVFGLLTFLFLVSLVFASVMGKPVPPDSRMLVVSVLAIGVALSASFLGGTASASGKLPLPVGMNPISFAVSGGIATFLIVFVIAYLAYFRTGQDSVTLSGTVQDADTTLGISRATIVVKTDTSIIERQTTDAGDFRISDIPDLFGKQVSVSARAENYKPADPQTVLTSSYVQRLKFEMHSCYNGIWQEVRSGAGTRRTPWEFKVSGSTLHTYRTDGSASGDFQRGADGNWIGEVSSTRGDKPTRMILNAPNANCNQIITNQSRSYERDTK
jgi:hypothetical protein